MICPRARRASALTFSFNGGPGSSSGCIWGCWGRAGWRWATGVPDRRQAMDENQFSLLDESDLVFIDPVGTGFSRGRRSQPRLLSFKKDVGASVGDLFAFIAHARGAGFAQISDRRELYGTICFRRPQRLL
ncbi:MAG: hypothetical protein R2911_36300 [Caldilineaceae bacterium]